MSGAYKLECKHVSSLFLGKGQKEEPTAVVGGDKKSAGPKL